MVLMALLDVVLPGFFLNCFFFFFAFPASSLNILFKCNNFFFFHYSCLHYSVHECIVLAFFTVHFPPPSCLPVPCFSLSLISMYFSDWAPLSTLSLSEEISSYKAAAISLQESKMNCCRSIIFFFWRPKGEMRKSSCSSFWGQLHRKYFGRGVIALLLLVSQACVQILSVGYRKYWLCTYIMQGSANC